MVGAVALDLGRVDRLVAGQQGEVHRPVRRPRELLQCGPHAVGEVGAALVAADEREDAGPAGVAAVVRAAGEAAFDQGPQDAVHGRFGQVRRLGQARDALVFGQRLQDIEGLVGGRPPRLRAGRAGHAVSLGRRKGPPAGEICCDRVHSTGPLWQHLRPRKRNGIPSDGIRERT